MGLCSKLKLKLKMKCTKTCASNGVVLLHKHPKVNKVLRKAICRGDYELPEVNALKNMLTAEDRVLELGTCVGYLASYVAKVCGSDNVKTVEANTELLDIISANFALNGVTPQVINAVAGIQDGKTVDFFVCNNIFSSARHQQNDSRKITVPMVNINRIIDEFKPTLMLIDIEGGEHELVPNLNLSHVQKIIIEIHPHKIGNKASTEVIKALFDKGFVMDFASCDEITYAFVRLNG